MVSCVDCYIGTAKNLERLCLFAHCFAIPRLCVSCVEWLAVQRQHFVLSLSVLFPASRLLFQSLSVLFCSLSHEHIKDGSEQ